MNFKDIIGNEKEKEILQKIIKSNQIGHSYIFLGVEGIGKKLIAKEFAKKILCLSKEKGCNKCQSCIEFEGNNHPDYVEITPDGKNIKIDQIREFQQKVFEKPVISTRKIYVIDDADKMTKEAQNCLLKTLEEPPSYVVIILIVANEDKLLNTIRSRCSKMVFSKLTIDELKKYIKDENTEENMLIKANGSIKRLIHIQENKETYIELESIINKIQKQGLLDVLKLTDIFTKNKDIVNEMLDYMSLTFFKMHNNNSFYGSQANFINCIKIIEEVKRRIAANSNYDMCIDYLYLKIWEEINEEHSRCKI